MGISLRIRADGGISLVPSVGSEKKGFKERSKPMPTETQLSLLFDGRKVSISRNGNHQYWIEGEEDRMPSVTSMLGHLDSGAFGVGMGWALKQARLADGDLDAPRRLSKEAQDEGNRLHDAIHQFIENGTVDETNDLFVVWLNQVGNHHEWSASERFLFHAKMRYGGTADAFSRPAHTTIWDWKSKDAESYSKYGGSIKDHAQLGAYAMGLREMGSIHTPTLGKIAYIMRDGSGVDVVPVDLDYGWELFKASHHIYTLLKGAKQ